MKRVITLDPEYIPWEPGAPVVRLRRRRNKTLGAALGIGLALLLCGAMALLGTQNKLQTQPTATSAAATAQPTATPGIVPTPQLITQGRPGYLTLVRRNVVNFLQCEGAFVIRSGNADVLAVGDDTLDGPIIDVSVGEVHIECAGYKTQF